MKDTVIPGLPNWRAQELLGWLYGKRTHAKWPKVSNDERRALVAAKAAMWSPLTPCTVVGTHHGRALWTALRARIK